MYISLRNKFIFLHIPKNAGSAVRVALEQRVTPDPELKIWARLYYDVTKDTLGLHFKTGARILPHHGTQPNLKIFLDYLGQRVDNFFEFAIIRHPYDRITSFVKYSKVLDRINKSEILTVDHVLDNIENNSSNFYASQMQWIDNPITKKIHIYKYEELAQYGWSDIRNKLNLDLPDLLKVNVSPLKNVILTEEQKMRCYRLLPREFDELGYER